MVFHVFVFVSKWLRYNVLWNNDFMYLSSLIVYLYYCRGKISKVNNGPWAPHGAQPWQKGERETKRLLTQSCWAQFILKDVRGGMSPRTHKYGPNVRPLHSEEPSQTNVGSRMSLTQQERGKCKTSKEKPQLPH